MTESTHIHLRAHTHNNNNNKWLNNNKKNNSQSPKSSNLGLQGLVWHFLFLFFSPLVWRCLKLDALITKSEIYNQAKKDCEENFLISYIVLFFSSITFLCIPVEEKHKTQEE